MLPSIRHHSAVIFRCARLHQRDLVSAGSRIHPSFCLLPLGTKQIPVRKFSNENRNLGNSASSTLSGDTEKAFASKADGAVNTHTKDARQPELKESDPALSESSTVSKKKSSQTSYNAESDPAPDRSSSKTSPDGIRTIPIIPQNVPATSVDVGAIAAAYYDKAFRFWSERSGTSEILALKESVDAAGAAFDLASAQVTTNRRNLDEALRKWERASGQHLQLLQRRESWTPEDAQRFADFVSLEITSRTELEQARHDLARSEEFLTKSQLDYINKMRRRYHEEQIWQDQWRVLGTYGTWSLIVLNSCVFLGSQYFQRRRERERTETIAQLIRESRPTQVSVQVNAATDETAMGSDNIKESMSDTEENAKTHASPTGQDDSVTEEETRQAEIACTEIVKREADNAPVHESVESESPAGDIVSEVRPESKEDHRLRDRVGIVVKSVGITINRWSHRLRSDGKDLAFRVQTVIPRNIGEQMPKSLSDIHIPSAVIGATFGGMTVIVVSMVFSRH